MNSIVKPIDTLTLGDIETLITNGVPEGRHLDYKEELPGGSDEDRKEYLADITAFANSLGGHIVYGVKEERDAAGKATGVPEAITGLNTNLDTAITRLEQMLQSVDPRLRGVRFRAIDAAKRLIVCWIPKSWQAPHMVTFKGSSRFWARGTSAKHPMDVREIGASFLEVQGLREAIRRFRADRIAKVISGEASPTASFLSAGQALLHVVPIATFEAESPSPTFDLEQARTGLFLQHFNRYNLDGVLWWKNANKGPCWECIQLFRNGTIEWVYADLTDTQQLTINGAKFENEVTKAATMCFEHLTAWGVAGPFALMLSLVNVENYRLWLFAPPGDPIRDDERGAPIDRSVVVVPEQWFEQAPAIDRPEGQPRAPARSIETALRPTLDLVWQASGRQRRPA